MDEEEEPRSSAELDHELMKVIDYFRHEFRITYSEVVGVLEMVKHRILVESMRVEDSDDD